MPTSRLARVLVAALLTLVAASLAAPRAAGAQAPPVAALAFDDAGRLTEITPGIADRLGLRAPWWPVAGEYRRARLQRDEAGTALIVERFDGSVERLALTDDQLASLRLEVSARAGVLAKAAGARPALATAALTAAPIAAPSPAAPPMATASFMGRELVLGAALFGPLAWRSASSPAFSPSAYLATAGLTYLAALNAHRVAPFSAPASDLGLLGAVGGAVAGFSFARAGRAGARGEALAGLVAGVGGHVGGLVWGRDAAPEEARGALAGAIGGVGLAAGLLGATGTSQAPSGSTRERWSTAGLAAGALLGAPLARAYVRGAGHRITDGDLLVSGTTAFVGAALGRGFAGGDSRRRFAYGTIGGLAGLVAGDRWLATTYDHRPGDAGVVLVGAAAGAAIAALPYAIAGRAADDQLVALAGVGAALGIWGGEVVARPPTGVRRRRAVRGAADVGAEARTPARPDGPRLVFDPAALLFAAVRAPGSFSLVRLTF